MAVRTIYRGPTSGAGYIGRARSAPVRVDSSTNTVKVIVGGEGSTTEVEQVDVSTAQTLTNKTLTAPVITSPTVTSALVPAGGTLTLTAAAHAGKTIALNTATGSVVTLPAATGSGAVYRFLVTALATSNSHIVKVADANHTMKGTIELVDADTPGTVTGFVTASDSDTITLNRSTTGSVTVGEWIELTDIAANTFAVRGVLSNTGSGATPFSAAV